MFAVTGASGHFGRLVLDALIAEVPASQVVALARAPADPLESGRPSERVARMFAMQSVSAADAVPEGADASRGERVRVGLARGGAGSRRASRLGARVALS